MSTQISGANWGAASVENGSLTFKSKNGKDPLFTVDKDSIRTVTNTRTDVTVNIKPPEAMPAFFCREVKLTAAPDSTGVPTGEGAGQFFAKQLQAGGAGGSLGASGGIVTSEAAARKTGKTLCGEFEGVTISQPNGNFNIWIYTNQIVLHDTVKGHYYVVPVANVQQLFLLGILDMEARYFVVSLKTPLQVGSTHHSNLVFSFPDNQVLTEEEPWKAALSEADITKHFESTQLLKPTMSGPVFQIVASVFKAVCKVSLIGAHNEYQARATSQCALPAQFKGSNGTLYVLKKYLIFLHRPATVIPYETINGEVDMETFDTFASMQFSIPRKTGSGYEKLTIGSIPKNEVSLLAAYLRTRGLKVDDGSGGADGEDDDDDDDESDEDYDDDESSDDDDSDDGDDSDDSDAPKKKSKKSKKEKKSKSDKKSKKEKKEKKHKKDKKDKKRSRE